MGWVSCCLAGLRCSVLEGGRHWQSTWRNADRLHPGGEFDQVQEDGCALVKAGRLPERTRTWPNVIRRGAHQVANEREHTSLEVFACSLGTSRSKQPVKARKEQGNDRWQEEARTLEAW